MVSVRIFVNKINTYYEGSRRQEKAWHKFSRLGYWVELNFEAPSESDPKKKFCLLVQDTPWFYCLVKLLVYSFWHFETNTHNKQGLIEDTSVSFLCDFMTVFTKWKYANVCKIEIANYRFLFWHISILQITDFHFANYRFLFCKSFWRIRERYCNYFNSILLQLFSL